MYLAASVSCCCFVQFQRGYLLLLAWSTGVVSRWMGNMRFTVGALQQIMQGKTHHARIAVLPYDQAEAAIQHSTPTVSGQSCSCNGTRTLPAHVLQTLVSKLWMFLITRTRLQGTAQSLGSVHNISVIVTLSHHAFGKKPRELHACTVMVEVW